MIMQKTYLMENKKINSIQGLRAIAFLAIFISHTGLGNFGCLGAWGVSVFFALSGFLMMLSHLNKGDNPKFGFGFAWNKIRSLYPLHFVTMLLAAVYAAYCGQHLMKVSLDIVIHSLLIQMWIPNTKFYTTLNGPAWYLCTTFFLYLCFPLIYKACKKSLSKETPPRVYMLEILGLALLDLMISIICFFFAPQDGSAWFTTKWIVYYFPPVRLIDFTIGCLAGCLFFVVKTSSKINLTNQSATVLELVNCVFICFSWVIYAKQYRILGTQAFRFSLLYIPTTTSLVWLIASDKGLLSRVLRQRLFVKVGDLSPYTFLIHDVAIKYCTVFLQYLNIGNKMIMVITAFILTMVSAYVWKPLFAMITNKTQ